MKRIATIFVVLVMLAMATAVQAGESWVFTDQQEANIKNAIRSAHPKRPMIIVFAFNDFAGSFVDCHIKNPEEYVQLDISRNGEVRVEVVGRGTRKETAEKIHHYVAAVFHPSAGVELERNLLERRGIK